MDAIKKPFDQFKHLDRFQHLVAHCKKSPFDVYIGRDCKGMPAGTEARWGNPFVMKNQSEEERFRVTALYEEWLLAQPDVCARAKAELRGKVLGCFCSPLMCHGRVLAAVANAGEDGGVGKGDSVAPVDGRKASASAEAGAGAGSAGWSREQLRNKMRRERKRVAKQAAAGATGGSPPAAAAECRKDADRPPVAEQTDYAAVGNLLNAGYVDIGINVTNRELKHSWKGVVSRAVAANVTGILLTGTTVASTEQSLQVARQWLAEEGSRALHCTAGVHPHHAKAFTAGTFERLRELARDPFVVAVGECGLDFNRNLSSREEQLHAFRQQVRLACQVGKPLFVHEREAHRELLEVLDEEEFAGSLPPLVVHCFTGNAAEAAEYIRRGFYIGFTGTICKKERGAALRELIADIPLDRVMIETDAPYMGFLKTRRNSEPADVVLVAEQIARCLGVGAELVRQATTANAARFFRLPLL